MDCRGLVIISYVWQVTYRTMLTFTAVVLIISSGRMGWGSLGLPKSTKYTSVYSTLAPNSNQQLKMVPLGGRVQ